MTKVKIILNALCLFLFLFITNNKVYAQINQTDSVKSNHNIKPVFSTELNFSYPNYFMKNEKFNYGFGGSLSVKLNRVKISLGLNYRTKKYVEYWYNNSYFDKIEYDIDYYNIPVTISFLLFNKDLKKKNDLIIGAGIVFNIPHKYEAIIPYKHPLPVPSPYHPDNIGFGESFKFSLRYQRYIAKRLDFFFSGTCYYKFFPEYTNSSYKMNSWSPRFVQDKVMLEISSGLEFYFNK